MIDEISQTMRELYEATENQFKLEVQLAIKNQKNRPELLKQLKVIKAKADEMLNLVTERASNLVGINKKPLTEQNEKMSKLLVGSAMREFIKAEANVKRLTKTIPLQQAIFEQTQRGINNALPIKVNGRNYGYKEYMEMNVRTTMQQEIGEQQLKSGKAAGVVFYLSNFFGDSADDHADYQGQIYYDERYKSFNLNEDIKARIAQFIAKERLKSVQWVRDKPVYLTTRPNCRHTLTPISIDQALQSNEVVSYGQDLSFGKGLPSITRKENVTKKEYLLRSLQLKRGTYKDKNYQLTQEQRYNERMIRKFKARAEANKQLGYDNKHDRVMVSQWQARQRELIKANPQLERDYRRETRKVLLTDLGAKYS
jgi:hypothetical protein